MITIFTIANKPFKGHTKTIVSNALNSWTRLSPKCEIILFSEQTELLEFASFLGIKCVSEMKKNDSGTPLLSYVFKRSKDMALNNVLAYVNSDIILTSDFTEVIQTIDGPVFLLNGRRWDLDVGHGIDFQNSNWEKQLIEQVRTNGHLRGYSAIDYFVFPRSLPIELPDFAVGIVGWDNWLVFKAKSLQIPIIDCTESINAIHQNHDYSHSCFANEKRQRVEGPEMKENIRLAGGFANMLTIREADWILSKQALRKPTFPRSVFSKLSSFYFFRYLLYLKRTIQNF